MKSKRNYLLGFRKRKQERKAKAKEELEEQIKQEKKRQRELVSWNFCRRLRSIHGLRGF